MKAMIAKIAMLTVYVALLVAMLMLYDWKAAGMAWLVSVFYAASVLIGNKGENEDDQE